jgi:hypothetical protein
MGRGREWESRRRLACRGASSGAKAHFFLAAMSELKLRPPKRPADFVANVEISLRGS